ncbi:ABC transporter ATP-binding protein [Paenibacillus ginsengarvi]|nr:ABC transporter ATP-binding protein [Paenibacillus ginsengarvi]
MRKSLNKAAASIYEGLGRLIRLASYFWRSGRLAALVVIGTAILQGLAPVVELWALGRLVDRLSAFISETGGAYSGGILSGLREVLPWVALIVFSRLAARALAHLNSYAGTIMQETMTLVIHSEISSKAAAVPLRDYELPEFHDKLSRAKSGMGLNFANLFVMTFMLLRSIVTLAGLVVIATRGHWLIPVLILAAGLPVLRLQNKMNDQRYALVHGNTLRNRMKSYVLRLLTDRSSAKEVRLFGLGPYLTERWYSIFEEVRKRTFRQAVRQRTRMALAQTLPVISFGVSLALLLGSIVSGRLTLGAAVSVIAAVLSMQSNWETCIRTAGYIHELFLRFVKDLLGFLDMPEREEEGRQLLESFEPGGCDITVDNVSFTYPGSSEQAVKGIKLRLKPGEKVALLGENGAGKSTLVKLLLGLYEPSEGAIRYGSQNIAEVERSAVWGRVSAVFQDYAQYHLTVRDNIGFGLVGAMNDRALLRKAARGGGAAVFVERWEQEYETYLGPTFGGRDLSGGQWQKVASSRGFMREPLFLALDEPTAALDPEAEADVYRRFRDMAGDRTALLVSHRIGFARLADRILVMKDGELIESGTHESLLAHGGEYAKLLSAQSQWYR